MSAFPQQQNPLEEARWVRWVDALDPGAMVVVVLVLVVGGLLSAPGVAPGSPACSCCSSQVQKRVPTC